MNCQHNLPAGCCMICAHEQRLERYRQNLAAGITPEPATRDDGTRAPFDGWGFNDDKFRFHYNEARHDR